MGASLLRRGRPNEEGQVGSWTPLPVCVEEMVRSDIVLIDGFLYQTHPEEVRVKIVVTARIRRDRREMVDTVELHGAPYTIRSGLADVRDRGVSRAIPGGHQKLPAEALTSFRQRPP